MFPPTYLHPPLNPTREEGKGRYTGYLGEAVVSEVFSNLIFCASRENRAIAPNSPLGRPPNPHIIPTLFSHQSTHNPHLPPAYHWQSLVSAVRTRLPTVTSFEFQSCDPDSVWNKTGENGVLRAVAPDLPGILYICNYASNYDGIKQE